MSYFENNYVIFIHPAKIPVTRLPYLIPLAQLIIIGLGAVEM